MAAVAPGGKLVQTIKLSYLPSCPGALAWSEDDRIAVVTDQCVYILVSSLKFYYKVSSSSHTLIVIQYKL